VILDETADGVPFYRFWVRPGMKLAASILRLIAEEWCPG